jgi:hypothetical protein
MYRSSLLYDDYPVLISPRLARLVGLHEAIIVQQIHYWLELFRQARNERHFQDGHWWVWNSARQWQEDNFPWWSEDTIRRVLDRLRKPFEPLNERDRRLPRGLLLITANFNVAAYDKTLWYRIDYEELDRVVIEAERRDILAELAKRAQQEPLFAFAASEGADLDALWPDRKEGQGDKRGPGFLEKVAGVSDPLALAAACKAAGAGKRSWTVPTAAGGASAYAGVLEAFCEIIKRPVGSLGDDMITDWLLKLEQIAEKQQIASPELMGQAVRVLPDTNKWALEHNVWSSPHVESFEPALGLVAARLASGQGAQWEESPHAESGADSQRTRRKHAPQTAAVGLGPKID